MTYPSTTVVEFSDLDGRHVGYETLPADEHGVPADVVIFQHRRYRRHPRMRAQDLWPYLPTKEYRPFKGESNSAWLARARQAEEAAAVELKRQEERTGLHRPIQQGQPFPVIDEPLSMAMTVAEFAEEEVRAAAAAVRLEGPSPRLQ